MSQFVHPIRCWLNPPLFCVSIHYSNNPLDAFEVYLGCCAWLRVQAGAQSCLWTQCPAHSCVVSRIATAKCCPLPSPRVIICSEAVAESQNGWGWKPPLKTAWSTPPLRAESNPEGFLGHVQVLNICKDGDTTAPMGNTFQCLPERSNIR